MGNNLQNGTLLLSIILRSSRAGRVFVNLIIVRFFPPPPHTLCFTLLFSHSVMPMLTVICVDQQVATNFSNNNNNDVMKNVY